MIPVFDVGSPQGTILPAHFAVLASKGARGIYARCGNGNDPSDTFFAVNVAGAAGAGLAVGPYHVLFPLPDDPAHSGRDPIDQARAHFAASGGLGAKPGEMRPVCDWEWPMPVDWPKWGVTAKDLRTRSLAYLAEIERLYARVPMIYMYPDFEKHALDGATPGELAAFRRYPQWLALYGVAMPRALAPWAKPMLWQASDGGGRLPGGQHVDEDWQAFLQAA